MSTKLLGISGSLRSGSLNTALLRAAQSLTGSGVELAVATLHGIPLYDGDVEAQGIPTAVAQLKEQVAAADGVLLVTPEYNNSVPGVFKNAIDWLSRPSGDAARIFRDRPFAVIGASPGGFGTILSQAAWVPILRLLNARVYAGQRLLVSKAGDVIDVDAGKIRDDKVREQLQQFLAGFAAFAAERPHASH